MTTDQELGFLHGNIGQHPSDPTREKLHLIRIVVIHFLIVLFVQMTKCPNVLNLEPPCSWVPKLAAQVGGLSLRSGPPVVTSVVKAIVRLKPQDKLLKSRLTPLRPANEAGGQALQLQSLSDCWKMICMGQRMPMDAVGGVLEASWQSRRVCCCRVVFGVSGICIVVLLRGISAGTVCPPIR